MKKHLLALWCVTSWAIFHTADATTVLKPACTASKFPAKDRDWNFLVAPYDEKPWTYSLTIPEVAEDYLGTAIFDSLPKRFAKIPGIVGVIQEDREYYLIQSRGLSAPKLKAALWRTFKAAAAEACRHK